METIFEHNKKKIATAVLVFVVILSIFFAVKIINEIKQGKYIGTGTVNQSVISVSGRGEVFATPDVANLTFAITKKADTVEKAQNLVTEKMNNILEFLNKKDIEKKDIKTTGYNIYPKYEYQKIVCFAYPCENNKRVLIGYEVRHNISLKIRKIDNVGEVLAGLGKIGATNVSGISFSIDKKDSFQGKARALAIKEAQKKAEQLADELNVKLVRVVSFSEQNASVILPRFEMMNSKIMGSSATPNIPVGENNLISNVNITYEIK